MGLYHSVLILVNMQNDICHEDGVFHKNGLTARLIPRIIPPTKICMDFCKKMKIPIIALMLTSLESPDSISIGSDLYKKNRPFLIKEGLREGTWGHQMIEQLPPANYYIRKWNNSAFYQTELEYYLEAIQCEELIVCGFATNGSVESLAREATARNYKVNVLSDCVTSYSPTLHEASLANLSGFAKIATHEEWQKNFSLLMP
ncbi:MAG: cysteine hydrolase [Parachlamydiales bacterium]|nr:cysteine hydrolase [Parachlamydiales bacterium]